MSALPPYATVETTSYNSVEMFMYLLHNRLLLGSRKVSQAGNISNAHVAHALRLSSRAYPHVASSMVKACSHLCESIAALAC